MMTIATMAGRNLHKTRKPRWTVGSSSTLDRLQEELVLTVKPPSRGRKGPSVFNSGMAPGRQLLTAVVQAHASESSGTASGDRGVRDGAAQELRR